MKKIEGILKEWGEVPINRLYDWQCVLRLYCKDGQENIMVTEEGRDALDFIIYWYKRGKPDMYIVSNQYGLHGAVCIRYPEVLEGLAGQLGADLILLPSSIHEFLILPCKGVGDEVTGISEIVKEVNQMVSQEDILSDHAYLYDRAKKEICSV